ncbi:MAG: hypothetical protein HFH87_16165 [Lachnospiraceae bacterium]|nr:hypothetical protein [Lachnospiraceae bacterium]
MKIETLMEYDLQLPAKQVRSVPVALGEGKEGVLFVYSREGGVDPGEEFYHHPVDTLKFAVFDGEGNRLWVKDLGPGVIPGVWFCPVLPLDLDQDGVDEIYFLNNISPDTPFSFLYRKLEALDPRSGETMGRWDWPQNTFQERLSLCYRFYLVAGYDHGEPVLITSQGTYGDMYLQGYGPGMVKKWETVIRKSDPGPRASHLTPVLDFNDDGVDELFWGERLLSVADGSEVLCCDKYSYRGHSDIIIPFLNFETEERFIFTCREGDEREGVPRVVTFREDGTRAWTALEHGHMHFAWLATVGEDGEYRRVIMAMDLIRYPGETGLVEGEPVEYYFDAYTGEQMEMKFPCYGSWLFPIDINGDGYSEFFCCEGELAGWLLDRHGEKIKKLEGMQVKNGRILKQFACEQMMLTDEKGIVRVYGDAEAEPGELFRKRHDYKGYHAFQQRLMASGYNHYRSNISCGI